MIWCLYCQATKLINRATFIIWLDGNKLAKVLLVGNRKTLFRQQVSLLQPWASEIQQSETTKGPTHYGLQSPSSSCLRLHLIIVKCTCIRLEMNSSLSLSLTHKHMQTHAQQLLAVTAWCIYFPKKKQSDAEQWNTHTPSPLPSFSHSHTQSQQCALHKVVSSGIISRPVVCTCKRGCQYIDQTTAQAEINEASSVTITQAEGALGLKADIMCQSSAKWFQHILFKKLSSEGERLQCCIIFTSLPEALMEKVYFKVSSGIVGKGRSEAIQCEGYCELTSTEIREKRCPSCHL